MRKVLILIFFISFFFSREHIAVIDFEGINVSEAEAKALTNRVTSVLIDIGEYTILERSEMKKLLDEQKFQYSGCVDTKCAVKIGKMIGAKYIVVGSISKVGNTYSIDSRLINVETGESYGSGNFIHTGEIDYLLTEGMKTVAYQISDVEYQPKKIKNKNYNKIFNFSFFSKRLNYIFEQFQMKKNLLNSWSLGSWSLGIGYLIDNNPNLIKISKEFNFKGFSINTYSGFYIRDNASNFPLNRRIFTNIALGIQKEKIIDYKSENIKEIKSNINFLTGYSVLDTYMLMNYYYNFKFGKFENNSYDYSLGISVIGIHNEKWIYTIAPIIGLNYRF